MMKSLNLFTINWKKIFPLLDGLEGIPFVSLAKCKPLSLLFRDTPVLYLSRTWSARKNRENWTAVMAKNDWPDSY